MLTGKGGGTARRPGRAEEARSAAAQPFGDEKICEMELSRLRAENARLKMHVEILKKATAYFAKDAL